MPKRVLILLLIAATAVVLAILFSVGTWREPSYQGVRLRTWLPGYEVPGRAAQTDEAVQEMGAACVPFLLELLNATDSRTGQAFAFLADDLGFGHLHIHIHYVPADQKRRWALAGFRSLGPAGKAAVPDLVPMLRRDETRKTAVEVFAAIGAASVAPLTRALADSKSEVRAAAATALGECAAPSNRVVARWREPEEKAAIISEAKTAWPALIRCLKDPDPNVRAAAAMALADFGVEPGATVTALMALLGDNDPEVRGVTVVELGRFREAAQPVVPTLLQLLNDPDRKLSERAAFALRLIDQETAVQAGVK